MTTVQQVLRGSHRVIKFRKCRLLGLDGSPQKKGSCIRIRIMKPKKPNSALRKVARVRLSNNKCITAYIPGQGHNLQEHSVVMVRGGRTQDLPGLHYKLMRGHYDFSCVESFVRKKKRSRYGYPNLKKKLEDTNL